MQILRRKEIKHLALNVTKKDEKLRKFEKRSFFQTARTSQESEKLALIPWFCYLTDDFSGVDKPLLKNLKTIFSSLRGGEKPSNRSLSKLSGALGSAFVGATVLLSPMAASANDAAPESVQTASVITEKSPVPSVPMSERMEISERAARTVAATGSKDGIVFLVYGENQWLIDELSYAIYDGHQKGRAVKGIALGSSTAPDGFDVYVNGHRIAEARDVTNTDVRGGATYAIEYGQKVLDTRFSGASVDQTASLNP